MRIMREETFGPVLPVVPFDTDDEAVHLANDSEFGLAASVWTRDPNRGEAMARRIEAGTVMVNDTISCFGISEAPHGGVKASGIGRAHGRFGLEEMVRVKYLDSDRLPRMKKVWWYGYGETFARQMEGFVDLQFARRLGARVQRGAASRQGRLRGKLKVSVWRISSFLAFCGRMANPLRDSSAGGDARRLRLFKRHQIGFLQAQVKCNAADSGALAPRERGAFWPLVKQRFPALFRSFPTTRSKSRSPGSAPATRKTKRESSAAGI